MTLTHLIERCESGDGPDQLLNVQIENALGMAKFHQAHWGVSFDQVRVGVLPLTSSLDAVVSLIEQKLPGWCWSCERMTESRYEASVFTAVKSWDDLRSGEARSPARALLAACLRALSALEDSKAGLAEGGAS